MVSADFLLENYPDMFERYEPDQSIRPDEYSDNTVSLLKHIERLFKDQYGIDQSVCELFQGEKTTNCYKKYFEDNGKKFFGFLPSNIRYKQD